MKKQLLTIVFAFISVLSFSQVTGVNYLIELDEASGYYDCKLVINSGSATTIPERVQFNSFFTVVVPTGVEVELIESFYPLNLAFSTPAGWGLSNVVISPDEQPENDYYAFVPNISETAVYDELDAGDVVTLFRISADVDCGFEVRPIDNVKDETLIAASGTDYANGFTIGGTVQVYQGNTSPTGLEIDVLDSEYSLCVGECITISPEIECAPSFLTYQWSTGETTPSITVCPDVDQVYEINMTGAAGITASASISVYLENNFIYFDEADHFCVGQSYFAFVEFGGDDWQSSDESVASFDNNELLINEEGTVIITVSSESNGCFAETLITTTGLAEINFEGPNEICVGQTLVLTSTSTSTATGTWLTDDPAVASIDNNGLVTAIAPGSTFPIFIPSETGCVSTSDIPIVVISSPVITNTGADKICVGESVQFLPASGGSWESSNNGVAIIDNNGLVTGVGQGAATFVFTSLITGCSSTASEPLIVESCTITSYPSCDQIGEEDIICDMDLLNGFIGQMSPENSSGNQPDPLCPEGGEADNISWIGFVAPEGFFSIVVTPFGCQGSSIGTEGVQIGVYKNCTFTEAVQCTGTCSVNPTNIGNDNLEAGETYYIFIDGCSGSYCEFEIEVVGDYISQCESACDDVITEAPWEYVYCGEFVEDYNIITYTTAENLTNSNDRDHLVFYDYNTGNVFLKENNGNGFLENEIFLFNNEDHYANGIYHIYAEDIDNDGLTDIILAESNIVTNTGEIGDQISVYQNLDSYTFVRQINEQVCGMEGPNNLKIVDFDNDGMKDIFFVCTDFLYDILWINDWENTELSNFNSQNFDYIYTGDFNSDGFVDIAFDDGTALVNNGNRTFIEVNFIEPENLIPSLYYFIEESNILIDHVFAFGISGTQEFDYQYCNYFEGGDYASEIFRANINSPDEEVVLIPKITGFQTLSPFLECNDGIVPDQTPNVVARQNTKIDLTLNGCSDFLVIEGDQIFAWINPKQSNKILGTAFIDENANGLYDSDELPLRNVLVSIAPGDLSVLTDDEGNYAFSAPLGTYTITAHVNEGEWVETELMISDIEISEPCNEGYNFGFIPNSGPEDMATISMVNTIARCDFETRFTITIENTGEQPLEGVLAFTFDDKTTFFSSDIAGSQTNGNTVLADVGPVDPFSPESYKITVKMPGGSSNLPMLAFEAKLFDKFGEEIAAYGYSDQLRCSYDPNDKRALPDREGEENLTLMDEDLEYTIRFQNNGNDTAFLVKIVDPLDPNIDPLSIRVMGSSHAVETCVEGTDLVFLFEDILLVDSTTNYEASQGYVTFRCNVKEGIAEFTEVNNTADIIFDTNAPIITNQTINTLVTSLCSDKDTTLQITICEGDIYDGHTEAGVYTEIIELPFGCDSVVTLQLEVDGITYTLQSLDVCKGESVTILGEEYEITENTTIIDSTTNENGCLTNILTFEVNAISDILDEVVEIALCKGEVSTISPGLDGSWVSNDESIIVVDENGSFSTVNSGSTTLTFTDDQYGCTEDLEVTVFEEPVVENLGSNQICVDDNTSLISDVDGFWASDNPEVSIVNGENIAIGLSPGTANLIFTNSETGCNASLEIEVLPLNDISCAVDTEDVIGIRINLYPNPGRESIYIDTEVAWVSITVTDIQGRKISSINQSSEEKLVIDVSQYDAGVYMMIFQGVNVVVTKRFVKE